MRPFTRLQCECVFTAGYTELDQRLKRIDELLAANGGSALSKETIKEFRATIDILKKDYQDHISTYNRSYLLAMLELQKIRQINPFNVSPLQTNGWNSGDLKRLREPAPRKKKDEKKQKRAKK